jgi:hypothetical protein
MIPLIMMDNNSTGTMTLPSRSAVALWINELVGQLSDGMWENSGPRDHWKFWHHLDVVVGESASLDTHGAFASKNAYAFNRLFSIIGERMLATGRMARAGGDPYDRELLSAAQDMPATFEEFQVRKTAGAWDAEFVKTRMEKVDDHQAALFYATTYTMNDLRVDINLIKSTMKLARVL